MLKDALCSAPILKYPDTSKPYIMYTDTSVYGWAGVPTQKYTSIVDGKEKLQWIIWLHTSVDYFVATK